MSKSAVSESHHVSEKERLDYWEQMSSPSGRAKASFRVWRKRMLWNVVIGFVRGAKRVLDIVASFGALCAFSPIFLTTALLIKKEDGGPIFFKQKRVGYRGSEFWMWKFRSMVVNADQIKDELLKENEMEGGVTFKMKHDPRITKVGRVIRKLSIDELPQFWNVLTGEMSLVGPRPPVPREVAEYTAEDRKRLLAKPGITCFWQVGGRSDIDFEGQVKLDVQYLQSESIWVDIKLLFLTVPAVLLGKGAY